MSRVDDIQRELSALTGVQAEIAAGRVKQFQIGGRVVTLHSLADLQAYRDGLKKELAELDSPPDTMYGAYVARFGGRG